MGAITPVGNTKETFFNNLLAGQSGIDRISHFDPAEYATQIAGQVKDFDVTQYGVDKKEARRMDRSSQFAVAAAFDAVADSKLEMDKEDHERRGTIVGTGIGGIDTIHELYKTLFEKGPGRVSPFAVPMMISNMASGRVSIQFELHGPCLTDVTACASGTNAVGEAFRMIQHGGADVMIAGGTEAAISPVAVAGFANMKALSTNNEHPEKASCPFDKKREGFVMGEGAGVVVLEELEHAKARGAHIYAEICGYGMTADAYHITAPDPSGEMPAACMQAAVDDAGLKPEEVDYINAHGTSTHRNDLNETLAAKKVFGEHAYKMAISSNKSMMGHLLGAAGGVEAIATVLTIENSVIPPTINYEDPDLEEGLDLDYVPNVARKSEVNVAISNSFGFGGHNATILFKKYKD